MKFNYSALPEEHKLFCEMLPFAEMIEKHLKDNNVYLDDVVANIKLKNHSTNYEYEVFIFNERLGNGIKVVNYFLEDKKNYSKQDKYEIIFKQVNNGNEEYIIRKKCNLGTKIIDKI